MDNWGLYIDHSSRDLVIGDDGDLVVIDGHDAVAQRIRSTLLTHKEEWVIDGDFGVDYDRILGQDPDEELVEALVTEAIFSEEDVAEISGISAEYTDNRALHVQFTVVLVDETTIDGEVEL